MTELTGITWDHPRGYAPLRACAAYEDIRVRWELRSLKDFGDLSLSELAARYDLIILDHPHVGEAAQGALVPFDNTLGGEALAALRLGNDTTSFRSYYYQDRQWALPIDAACQVAAYRPDQLGNRPLPENWEAVFQLAETLKPAGLHIGIALCPTDTLCSFLTLAAQLGDAPVSDQWIKRKTVTTVIEKLCRLQDLSHPDCLNWNPIQLYQHMSGAQGTVAYSPLAFGYTDYSRAGSPSAHRLKFTNIPEAGCALLGGAGLGISANCAHPAEAARYAAWICGAEVQSTRYTENSGQPAHQAAWNDPACDAATGGFLSGTCATLQQAYTRPRLAGWPEFQEALGDTVHACLRGHQSIPATVEALEQLHQQHF